VQIEVLGPSFIQIGSPKNNFYPILFKFMPRSFSEVSLKIHFKFEEVSIDKVVPSFEPFKAIFYSKFSPNGKILFGSVKAWEEFELVESV
jgi:hypothetical protein